MVSPASSRICGAIVDMTMTVRPEHATDIDSIRRINLEAFEDGSEATLVEALRADAAPTISLVASSSGSGNAAEEIVGHIQFSPMQLLDQHGNPNALTRDVGTSRLGQGPSAHSALVQVEAVKS